MALMKFREPNQVAWQGSRPAHRGTQVLKEATVDNSTAIIHTVTSGKTLYLCTITLGTLVSVTGHQSVRLRDGSDVHVVYFLSSRDLLNVLVTPMLWTSWPPAEIPAGYDITVVGSGGGHVVRGTVFGWEE